VPVHVPTPVAGDPAGMRALAGRLRSVADSVGHDDGGIRSSILVMHFRGPAAMLMRKRVAGILARSGTASSQLSDAADQLMRAATQVEEAQRDRARLLALAAEEAKKEGST